MPSTCCPECDAVIKASNLQVCAEVSCHERNVELEIVATDPLDIAFDDDRARDWDTAWDDDDYSP